MACNGGGTDTTQEPPDTSSTGTSNTMEMTTPGTVPTTTGNSDPTTTSDATTEPLPDTSTGDTTGPTETLCIGKNENDCNAMNDVCRWGGVVQYGFAAQGCQGNIAMFCTDRNPSGVPTAWYREHNDALQVLEFSYTPTDLGPEWTQCDCNGPLACLCTSATEECPERWEEMCGATNTELGCENVTIKTNRICAWLQISPEGPQDDMCDTKQKYNRCLPAEDAASNSCDQAPLPPYFGICNPMANVDPVFWRIKDDTVELIETCGPKPLGFTRCESEDTPEQPDECGCLCL